MKNKKILVIAPILFVVCAVGILFIRQSYSAPAVQQIAASPDETDNSKYRYIRRNMLSHHYITNNSDPSGTILLKSGSVNSVSGTQKIVYCAHKGKWIAKSSQGRYYKRVSIEKTKVSALKKAKERLIGVMTNSYPYITLGELKRRIKAGLGEDVYNQYKFDTLDVQEAMTATQAAIWNAIAGNTKSSRYRTTGKVGSIKYRYFHKKGDNLWPINWDSKSSYDIFKGCYKGTGEDLECGAKSTFLTEEDKAIGSVSEIREALGSYKTKKQDSMLGKRINKLIDWYFTLKGTTTATGSSKIPSFTLKPGSDQWTDQGKKLSLTVLSNDENFLYAPENKYTIEFKDLDGKKLTYQEAGDEKSDDKTIGKKYTIENIETNGITVSVTAQVASDAINVYVYEANTSYSNTQYLIGAESGNIPIEDSFQVMNENKGKVYIYKKGLKSVPNTLTTDPVIQKGNLSTVCTVDDPCQDGVTFAIYQSDGKTLLEEVDTTDLAPIELTLPVGDYYIQEVSAPANYNVNSKLYPFKISQKDEVISIQYNNVPTMVCVQKISSVTKKPIEDGATFQLLTALGNGVLSSDDSGNSDDGDDEAKFEEFKTYAQVNDGVYCMAAGQLPVGYYYIVETEAPNNYKKENVKYRIKVGDVDDTEVSEDDEKEGISGELSEEVEFEDGSTIKDLALKTLNTYEGKRYVAVIENTPTTAITKSDVVTGECVPGAHLVVEDSNGNKVDEWVSSCEEGKDSHQVELKPGDYTLVEELAPSGYATAESVDFTVNADGSVSTSLDMKDAPIEACFQKVSGSKKGIAGAEFEIYDSAGKLYKKFTTSEAETCFQYIPVGKYTVKETKAPAGYKALEKPLVITIEDTSETQNFEINNEVEAAKTAMDASQMVIVIASVFMICGLGLVLYYGYKKQV